MAKRRKTRAQKKLSDFRHNFTHTLINQTVLTPQTQTYSAKSLKAPSSSGLATSYPFLAKDISKTAALTFVILSAQIILYFLLINHTFKIPGLNY